MCETDCELSVRGQGVGSGSAAGRLCFYRRRQESAAHRPENADRRRSAGEERQRLHRATETARRQLEELYRLALDRVGEEEAEIFQLHGMLLEDEQLISSAEALIAEGRPAEEAMREAAERCGAALAALEDDYLSARVADLRDVAARVAEILQGAWAEGEDESAPAEGAAGSVNFGANEGAAGLVNFGANEGAAGSVDSEAREGSTGSVDGGAREGAEGLIDGEACEGAAGAAGLVGGGAREGAEGRLIIVADDLTPAETVRLDRDRIAGFVTFGGSPSSHTAILARALGLPALCGAEPLDPALDGAEAIIDAAAGRLYVRPGDKLRERLSARLTAASDDKKRHDALRGRPTVTRSGRRIRLYANIGSVADAALALRHDAEGVGLLRSEFLYLGADSCPDEQTLLAAYRDVLRAMEGRPIIIRTLDIGADKRVPFIRMGHEENPALGMRGVRLLLARPQLLRAQLRAICRASAEGPVSVMLPMVTLPSEVEQCRAQLREVQDELRTEGLPFDPHMPFGIMLETPAAALMSAELARLVDFFSVGTNDLVQYTLAADRQAPALAALCEQGVEPVLRLIGMAAEAAHAAGIWIGICGELAAAPELTARLIALGVDELSVSPPYVLPLRERISDCD